MAGSSRGRRGGGGGDAASAPAPSADNVDPSRDADSGAEPSAGPGPDLAELIRFLAVSLVDKGDQVHVALVEERAANVYELEVAEDDLGMIIGRGGKTARALRTLVQAVAPKSRKRTMVEILE